MKKQKKMNKKMAKLTKCGPKFDWMGAKWTKMRSNWGDDTAALDVPPETGSVSAVLTFDCIFSSLVMQNNPISDRRKEK